jgi:hypothetical protein
MYSSSKRWLERRVSSVSVRRITHTKPFKRVKHSLRILLVELLVVELLAAKEWDD